MTNEKYRNIVKYILAGFLAVSAVKTLEWIEKSIGLEEKVERTEITHIYSNGESWDLNNDGKTPDLVVQFKDGYNKPFFRENTGSFYSFLPEKKMQEKESKEELIDYESIEKALNSRGAESR